MKKYVITLFSLLIVGCGQQQTIPANPPSMSAIIDGEAYLMEAGGFRWEVTKGGNTKVTQTDAAAPNQIAKDFDPVAVDTKGQIKIASENNPELTAYLWNDDGRVKGISLDQNQLQVPADEGSYIYEVIGEWPNGEASYTFVVEVK